MKKGKIVLSTLLGACLILGSAVSAVSAAKPEAKPEVAKVGSKVHDTAKPEAKPEV